VHVNEELRLFDASLARKPQLAVVNKLDVPEVRERMEEIRRSFRDIGTPVTFISAATGEGVERLMTDTLKLLEETGTGPAPGGGHRAVFRPRPKETAVAITKDEHAFIIDSHELNRLVLRVDMNDPEVYRQMQRQMGRLGITRALEKAGIQPGDKVRCGEKEWEW
jgi:GTP-binding protein